MLEILIKTIINQRIKVLVIVLSDFRFYVNHCINMTMQLSFCGIYFWKQKL
jgi:hypothetical protein